VGIPSFVSIPEKPTQKSYPQGMLEDPVHRSDIKGGPPLTRTRNTAVPKTRVLFYQSMSETSKQSMETWERDTIGYGGEEFEWTDPNPNDARTYEAILTRPIEYNLHPQSPDKWQARLRLGLLREV